MKKTINNRSLIDKYQANCDRIGEIADLCEKENRERTKEETDEYNTLKRENELLMMRAQSMQGAAMRPAAAPNVDKALRETLAAMKPATISLQREVQTTAALEDTGIIPVNEQEMLKPLRAGLIYDLVGLNIRTGLSGTKLRWARHGKAVAQFANEGERLVDAKVDFDKLDTKPVRLGIAVPVTREELENSKGIVENVVREEMPAAIVEVINEAMFSTTDTYTDAKGATKKRSVVGPFVKAAEAPVQFAGALPTRKELLKMKAQVTTSGIKITNGAWVMSEATKAELEDIKVDAGSGRFLCENDRILGYPVFTTSAIGEGVIGFGDWSYQAAGFFGNMNLVVDPYTLARQNATDFVLNTHFATATLYPEAFVVGVAKA